MANKYFITKTGTKRMCQTTRGWKFLVQWANGTSQWIELLILKESNPIQVAEYVTARGIGEEPAFAWWVPYVLQKQDVIVAAVNSRVQKRVTNMGLKFPLLLGMRSTLTMKTETLSGRMLLPKRWATFVLPLKFLALA